MEKVEIKKLIEQCLNYFYESGYAKGSIGLLQVFVDKRYFTVHVGQRH